MPVEVNMPRGSKPKRYPPKMVTAVRHLYISGMTQVEVAEALGTTQKVIWTLMRNHNIPRRPQIKRDQTGPKNHMWKGDEASYSAFHLRVQTQRGRPRHCEVCGTTDQRRSYDWANLSGRFDDPSDYKRMCRSCHWKHDRKILNIKHMRRKEDASDSE